MDLRKKINDFIEEYRNVSDGSAVYNEFSLQHELGFFLRRRLKGEGYKVEFERNVSFFGINKDASGNFAEKYAIELKYPRNGQYPESMYSCVKDIKFMEELRENGFNGTAVLTFVDDRNFYSGRLRTGIYSYFRATTPISGVIEKPTGRREERRDDHCDFSESYNVNWQEINADLRYYTIVL